MEETEDTSSLSETEQKSYTAVFGFSPRRYQLNAFAKSWEQFDSGRPSTLVVMATGVGKTEVASMVASREVGDGGRVLFVAHTDNLVDQALARFQSYGHSVALEKADEHAWPAFTRGERHDPGLFGDDPAEPPRFVVGSVQTLRRKRLECWPPGYFGLIVVDEAHHCPADSYRKLIGHLRPTRLLGLTATADRADGDHLVGEGQVFETLAYHYSISRGVEEGWLARPAARVIPCDVDLKDIRVTGDDLSPSQIAEALAPHVEVLCNESKPFLEGRRFICFTPLISTADAVASAYSRIGLSCVSISGQESRDEQRSILAEFRHGRYQGICNAMLLTEGTDIPFVDGIVMMRPTVSWSRFMQMIGRGTRKFPGKTNCRVLFFDWKGASNKLIKPVQIFDEPGKDPFPPAVLDEAQRQVDSGETPDLMQALKRAEKKVRERERIAVEVRERKARAKSYEFDMVAGGPTFDPLAQTGTGGRLFEAMATEAQVNTLLKAGFGHDFVGGLTRRAATGLIGKLIDDREKGLSSYKQQKFLKALGYRGPRLTFEAASDEIERRGGGRAAG